jgi:hypothetical protein
LRKTRSATLRALPAARRHRHAVRCARWDLATLQKPRPAASIHNLLPARLRICRNVVGKPALPSMIEFEAPPLNLAI